MNNLHPIFEQALAPFVPSYVDEGDKFKVGDKVRYPSSVVTKQVQEVCGLVVGRVQKIECRNMPTHYRVACYDDQGYLRVEGAERFFERE